MASLLELQTKMAQSADAEFADALKALIDAQTSVSRARQLRAGIPMRLAEEASKEAAKQQPQEEARPATTFEPPRINFANPQVAVGQAQGAAFQSPEATAVAQAVGPGQPQVARQAATGAARPTGAAAAPAAPPRTITTTERIFERPNFLEQIFGAGREPRLVGRREVEAPNVLTPFQAGQLAQGDPVAQRQMIDAEVQGMSATLQKINDVQDDKERVVELSNLVAEQQRSVARRFGQAVADQVFFRAVARARAAEQEERTARERARLTSEAIEERAKRREARAAGKAKAQATEKAFRLINVPPDERTEEQNRFLNEFFQVTAREQILQGLLGGGVRFGGGTQGLQRITEDSPEYRQTIRDLTVELQGSRPPTTDEILDRLEAQGFTVE